MKKIPYGITDFKGLIEENYIYVDKTKYLINLESGEKTLIYLKPGRFGKSLFTSMMYYYYDVNSESLFDILFKNTYVYKNPTPNKNNYYVLKFDFSGITTKNMSVEELNINFKKCVVTGLKEFLGYYKIEYKINEEDNPENMLKEFLSGMKILNLDHKLYIIVDEYDNFTNGILEGDAGLFKSVVNENGFVKSFYSNIKIYVKEGVVDRFFATGICPITLNSMTTGFNIATDISTKKEYNSMIGLTHEEVKNLFKELELSKEEQEKIYDIMIEHYDGYLFSEDAEERVFNATLVMYFLSEYIKEKKIPKKLYDNNITVNYGKVENLIKLQNNIFYKDLISEILTKGEITGTLKTGFNLAEDFTRDDIISLLYYFGYLTVKEADDMDIVFRVPNQAMRETYDNYFEKILREIDVFIEDEKERAGIREIASTGKIDAVTNYVSELLESTSNRIFIKFDEKYIELIYKMLLRRTLKFKTYIEYPCNLEFADIYIIGNEGYMDKNIMIELKYIKVGEYSETVLKEKRNEALEEINKYIKDDKIDKSKLIKYIVIFSVSELKLLEEVK